MLVASILSDSVAQLENVQMMIANAINNKESFFIKGFSIEFNMVIAEVK